MLCTASENLPWANIARLLLFQKTPEIYSVELSGTEDVGKTDTGDGKEKYRGLKDKRLELKKNHQKEELKKEVDLVS